jgi:hypothetical protein
MSLESLIVQRLGPESWPVETLAGLEDEMEDARDIFGERAEWRFAIPSIFRVLASPSSGQSLPRAPLRGDPLWFSCGYWSALLHMLLYSLGWARPDLGLWWWFENGKPTDDPRLQLMAEVFEGDGQLGWFMGWLGDVHFGQRVLRDLNEVTGWIDAGREAGFDPNFMGDQYREATASGMSTPIGSGYDELHLMTHCVGPSGGRLVVSAAAADVPR